MPAPTSRTASNCWVTGETGRPAIDACAITGPASTSDATAGSRVTTGARTERNTMNNSTITKSRTNF